MFAYAILYLREAKDPICGTALMSWLEQGGCRKVLSLGLKEDELECVFDTETGMETIQLSDRDILASVEAHADRVAASAILWKLNRVFDEDAYKLDEAVRAFVVKMTGMALESTPFVFIKGRAVNRVDKSLYKADHKSVDYVQVKVDERQTFVAVDLTSDAVRPLLLQRLRRLLWQN